MKDKDARLADCPEDGEMSEECRKAMQEEFEKAKEMEKKKGGSG